MSSPASRVRYQSFTIAVIHLLAYEALYIPYIVHALVNVCLGATVSF